MNTQDTGRSTSTKAWNRGIFLALCNIFHLIAAIQFWYGIYYDMNYVHAPAHFIKVVRVGGKFKYLTFLNCIVQAVFYTICLVNDIIGTNDVAPKKMPQIRKLKDYVFATFAFPLALTVGSTFWILMAIDRELVFPKAFDAFFPSWLNHVMHTNIVVFIVLEMFVSIHHYPIRKRGLTGLSIFMITYLIWVHILKFLTGNWVYPVLDVLNLPQRLVFYVAVLAFCASLYFVGEYVNSKIWSGEMKQIKSGKSKKK